MIYGTPQFKVDSDTTDKVGLRALIMSKLWQPSRWPMSLDEWDAETPAAPDAPSGTLITARNTQPKGGGLRTSWTFEGVHGDGKTIPFRTRKNSLDYEFQKGFSQVAIELHPNFDALYDRYGGTLIDGKVQWPRTISGGQGGFNSLTGGLAGGPTGGGKKNPLFGVEDFLRMEGSYSYRYVSLDLSEIPDNVGRVLATSALPGRPPNYPGRNWLGAASDYQRRGPVYEVLETYWLSGEGGWPKPPYR